jgi:hypothetical protein
MSFGNAALSASPEAADISPSSMPDAPTFDERERRATVRLVRYWHSLRGSARGRFFQDFKPQRNPIPWENCFLVRIEPGTAQPHLEHLGRGIITAFFAGPTIAPRTSAENITASLFGDPRSALADGALIKRDGSHRRVDGALVLYRAVLLPFVDGKGDGGYVLGAITCRIQEAEVNEALAVQATA